MENFNTIYSHLINTRTHITVIHRKKEQALTKTTKKGIRLKKKNTCALKDEKAGSETQRGSLLSSNE